MRPISIILMIVFMYSVSLQGQEQLQHKKKMYTSEDGKLYINKNLPVYLWLSVSPDADSEKIRLQSEDSKKYTNPLYFDTEGYNTVRTPSKVDTVTRKVVYPVEDIIFEVYADGEAPLVKISLDDSELFTNKGKLYAAGTVSVTLTAKDALSGVDKIYVSVNGAAFSEYKEALSLTEEKEYTVKAYAADNCGNASATVEKTFILDKSAPSTGFNVSKDQSEDVVSARSVIKLEAEDISGIKYTKYSLDGGTEQKYVNGIWCSYVKEGEHSISYYSEDMVGNKETVKEKKFYVDKTPPLLVDEMQGDSYVVNGKEFTSGRSKLKLTAMDNKAGLKEIYYTVNGKDYQLYTEPFYLPNNVGNQVVNYYAVDKVNNSNRGNSGTSAMKRKISYMDLTGPALKYSFIGKTFRNRDTLFIGKNTKIKLTAADSEAGVSKIIYVVNGGAEQQYSEPFSIEEKGIYNLSFTAYDNVMNSNNETFYFKLDNNGPAVNYTFSIEPIGKKGNNTLYPSNTIVFLTATDDECGFEKFLYSLNGSEMRLYTGFIRGLKQNTEYEITCIAYDYLGNKTEEKFNFATGD